MAMDRITWGCSPSEIELVKDGLSFWIRLYGTLCLKIEPHTGCIYWQPGPDNARLVGKIETTTLVKNWLNDED
jgi:hypothetical protein